MRRESFTPLVRFDPALRERVAGALAAAGSPRRCWPPAPATTRACWRPGCPTAMLFVRNPTGVSHSPAEHADPADCEAGVAALAAVLEELAGR